MPFSFWRFSFTPSIYDPFEKSMLLSQVMLTIQLLRSIAGGSAVPPREMVRVPLPPVPDSAIALVPAWASAAEANNCHSPPE